MRYAGLTRPESTAELQQNAWARLTDLTRSSSADVLADGLLHSRETRPMWARRRGQEKFRSRQVDCDPCAFRKSWIHVS